MRRLVWARVCLSCERKLNGARKPRPPQIARVAAPPEEPVEFEEVVATEWLSHLPRLLMPILFYGGVGLICRFGNDDISAIAAGALCADLLTWCIFSLARAPFEGVRFGVDLMVRIGLLILIQGPGLPWLSSGPQLSIGGISFFIVCVLRALWFSCWLNEMVDDPDEGSFEQFLPHLRE